jgi:DNA-binding NtrC family response regulator
MFELLRKLRQREFGTSKQTSHGERASNDSGSQVRVLAVTPTAGDWQCLLDIADRCGWLLFWADSCDNALTVLSNHRIPIVICDRDLPGEDWRAVLKRICAVSQPVCILLASSVSDEYLWREVTQHHGFDVLPKPFQPERLIRTVNLAWSWEGWMHRQPSHVPER